MLIRYPYASARTYDKAEWILEDMFAAGEVSASERPEIEHRDGRYYITLVDWNDTHALATTRR